MSDRSKNILKNSVLQGLLMASIILAISCGDDEGEMEKEVEAPALYGFERDGKTTVSYSGQTTRIEMAEALISGLKNTDFSADKLQAMFAHEKGNDDFSDADLNTSSKSIRSKVAASKDLFSSNTTDAAAVKEDFDAWIAGQVTEVFPKWGDEASAGNAGFIQEAGGGSKRYVNAEGLEYNQVINKGLIGGLMTDQIVNNYLSTSVLDDANNVTENDAGTVATDKNYTTMEHKWDEAFGYVYGAAADGANANSTIGKDDSFLNKYIGKVESDEDYKGIAKDIFDAFKLGRAAIVARDYKVRDAQAKILREKISAIIGIRAVYYLQQGKANIEVQDMGSAFHDLSEGYGFIYSLQFTRKPGTNTPYFTRTQVKAMLDDLMDDGDNGLWNVKAATLDKLSNDIATAFSLVVEEAGS